MGTTIVGVGRIMKRGDTRACHCWNAGQKASMRIEWEAVGAWISAEVMIEGAILLHDEYSVSNAMDPGATRHGGRCVSCASLVATRGRAADNHRHDHQYPGDPELVARAGSAPCEAD